MIGEQFLLSLLPKAKLSAADVNAKWKKSVPAGGDGNGTACRGEQHSGGAD